MNQLVECCREIGISEREHLVTPRNHDQSMGCPRSRGPVRRQSESICRSTMPLGYHRGQTNGRDYSVVMIEGGAGSVVAGLLWKMP